MQIEHDLPKVRRCELLDVARSTAYYQPAAFDEKELALMRLIDEIHLRLPFYGSRRVRNELEELGHVVNRQYVQRLMRVMDLQALYPRRRTSQPGKGHTVYPYLLRDVTIERPNHAWSTDITFSTPGIRRERDARTGSRVCRECRWARPGRSSKSNSSTVTKMSLSGSDRERAFRVM